MASPGPGRGGTGGKSVIKLNQVVIHKSILDELHLLSNEEKEHRIF